MREVLKLVSASKKDVLMSVEVIMSDAWRTEGFVEIEGDPSGIHEKDF